MLIAIKGMLGSGKTSVLTFIGFRQFVAGYNVYSNYGLNFPKGKGQVLPFRPEDLVNGNWQGPGILLLDEIQSWLESRGSGSSEYSRLATQMVLQTRKKDTHIAFTTQFLDQVDLRLPRLCEVIIEVAKRRDYAHLNILRRVGERTWDTTEKKLYLPPLYGLFNTREIIQPLRKPESKVPTVQAAKAPEPKVSPPPAKMKSSNVNVPI